MSMRCGKGTLDGGSPALIAGGLAAGASRPRLLWPRHAWATTESKPLRVYVGYTFSRHLFLWGAFLATVDRLSRGGEIPAGASFGMAEQRRPAGGGKPRRPVPAKPSGATTRTPKKGLKPEHSWCLLSIPHSSSSAHSAHLHLGRALCAWPWV